jgi:response regulator RpfG family c-di-GMP phosphodiesterase/anti-anti-sigma regulatory factor
LKRLRLERLEPRNEFRFSLRGILDADGARALDRVLFQCQARGAREVHLDFAGVTEVATLGLSVLERQSRVFESTERRIVVHGIGGAAKEALLASKAILYAPNGAGTNGVEPKAAAVAPVPAAPETAPAAPVVAPPAVGESPSAAEHQALHLKLRRKILQFRNIFEIAQGLNLARDLDAVLNLFSLSVMGQFGVERLALFLTDPDHPGYVSARQVRGLGQDPFRELPLPLPALQEIVGEESFAVLRRPETKAPSASAEPLVGGEVPAAPDASAAPVASATPVAPAQEVTTLLRKAGLEWAVALRIRQELVGMLFIGGRGSRKAFHEEDRDLVTILAHQAAVAIANARYHRQAEERNLGLVRGMMSLIESRDVYAKGSTERVVRFVTAMSRVLHVPQDQVKTLIYGAVLRDIGMIAVSHLILKNPAHLSEEEWAMIKQHPGRGAQILEEMNLPREVVDIVMNHHERWGGDGYPLGIRGPAIPLGARIVSLVDAYVAMTSERPYRRSLPYEKARQVISENWGTPFDPSLVEVFLAVLEKMERRSRARLESLSPAESSVEAAPGAEPERQPEKAELDPLASGATIPNPSSVETNS